MQKKLISIFAAICASVFTLACAQQNVPTQVTPTTST